MASVPSIPPLLCSTPPPIEFFEKDDDSGMSPTLTLEDEDDVFGEYTSPNEGLTPDVSSLPRTPLQNELSSSTTSGFTEATTTIFDDHNLDLSLTTKEINDAKVPVVEAFNYTMDTHHWVPNLPQESELTIPNEVQEPKEENHFVAVEESVQFTNYEVKLEDLPDDIENELQSPSKVAFDDTLDVNSKEYFAIHVVHESSSEVEADEVEKRQSELSFDANIEHQADNLSLNDDDNDDFAEFSKFERAAEPIKDEVKIEVTNPRENETSEFMFEADFSAFSATEKSEEIKESVQNKPKENFVETKLNDIDNRIEDKIDDFDDDDDEFGDFAEATVPTVVTNEQMITTQKPTPTVNLSNLNERLKTMLQTIFPTDVDIEAAEAAIEESTAPNRLDKIDNKIELPPIDAAKALNYQWAGSEMRNALIKSIGIDTRKILFGENWNPMMPRFAANLSCSPLQPLKSQNASQSSSDNVKLNDVPAVDFDWNSAGLVNPLDGKQLCANICT